MYGAATSRNILRPAVPGKCIDLLALFALLAGTATTFSLATPLMAQVLSRLTGLPSSKWVTIGILVVTCIIYTYALVHGMKGISRLSAACMYLFFALLAYVLLAGGETLPSEIWPRTSLAWPPSPIPSGPPPSPRPGPSFTGPTGWYGAWPLPSSSAPSPVGAP